MSKLNLWEMTKVTWLVSWDAFMANLGYVPKNIDPPHRGN